jgi:hypothetical protein
MNYWSPYSMYAIPTAYFTIPHNAVKYFLHVLVRFKPILSPQCAVHTTRLTSKYSSKFWNISFHERFFITTRYCFFRAILVQCTCSVTPFLVAKKNKLQVLNSFLGCSLCLFSFFCLFWLFTAFFGWKSYLLQFFTFFSNILYCIYSFTAAVLTLSVVQA